MFTAPNDDRNTHPKSLEKLFVDNGISSKGRSGKENMKVR